jgi:hypothetical protein
MVNADKFDVIQLLLDPDLEDRAEESLLTPKETAILSKYLKLGERDFTPLAPYHIHRLSILLEKEILSIKNFGHHNTNLPDKNPVSQNTHTNGHTISKDAGVTLSQKEKEILDLQGSPSTSSLPLGEPQQS